ncbi:hypothetical protein KKC97_02180 [bacterium]|nr:hypothetical protein [bacterium]MBU1636452.1 hypothetical protein [bacterium]
MPRSLSGTEIEKTPFRSLKGTSSCRSKGYFNKTLCEWFEHICVFLYLAAEDRSKLNLMNDGDGRIVNEPSITYQYVDGRPSGYFGPVNNKRLMARSLPFQ